MIMESQNPYRQKRRVEWSCDVGKMQKAKTSIHFFLCSHFRGKGVKLRKEASRQTTETSSSTGRCCPITCKCNHGNLLHTIDLSDMITCQNILVVISNKKSPQRQCKSGADCT